jgi:hypothetical protein
MQLKIWGMKLMLGFLGGFVTADLLACAWELYAN